MTSAQSAALSCAIVAVLVGIGLWTFSDLFVPFGAAKEAVRSQMLDPGATNFRNMSRCSGDRDIISGEANGKNLYGAYTGFKPFYFVNGTLVNEKDELFEATYRRCDGLPSAPSGKSLEADTMEVGSAEIEAEASAAANNAAEAAAAAEQALADAKKDAEASLVSHDADASEDYD